jgi:drug/metabolite transporter (DMT)-like permease
LVRLVGGAVSLAVLVRLFRPGGSPREGSWLSGLLLFAYAAPFSFAYLRLGAGVGALVLFGTVQVTMIAWGISGGERPTIGEWFGLLLAFSGLTALTLPGTARPDPASFLLMVLAGVAWGVYSLRGRGSRDPLRATAGNFLYSVPAAVLLFGAEQLVPAMGVSHARPAGIALAAASGALASGVAYSFWYAALPGLTALRAALVQLTVPVIATLGAVALLDEHLDTRLLGSGVAVLSGVALALFTKAKKAHR